MRPAIPENIDAIHLSSWTPENIKKNITAHLKSNKVTPGIVINFHEIRNNPNSLGDRWINALNALVGRLNRYLLIDEEEKREQAYLQWVGQLKLHHCTTNDVNLILQHISRQYYPAIRTLTLSVVENIDLSRIDLKALKYSSLKIYIHPADDSPQAREQANQLARQLARKLKKTSVTTYFNPTPFPPADSVYTLIPPPPEGALPPSANPAAEIEITTPFIIKFHRFKKYTENPLLTTHRQHENILSQLEEILFLLGHSQQTDKTISLPLLTSAINQIKKFAKELASDGLIYYRTTKLHITSRKKFLNEMLTSLDEEESDYKKEENIRKEIKELEEASQFLDEFFGRFFPKQLSSDEEKSSTATQITNFLYAERKAGKIPYCATQEEFQAIDEDFEKLLKVTGVQKLITTGVLDGAQLSILIQIFKKLQQEQGQQSTTIKQGTTDQFIEIIKLITELVALFGTKKCKGLTNLIITNEKIDFRYCGFLLNTALQFSGSRPSSETKSEEPTFFDQYIEILQKSKRDGTPWSDVKDQIESLLAEAYEKQHPEKSLDQIEKEFTTTSKDVVTPMTIEEFRKYRQQYETKILPQKPILAKISVEEFPEQTRQAVAALKANPSSEDALLNLLAYIRENIKRTHNLKIYPHNQQMIILLGLLNGNKRLNQTLTGEGKSTLLAMLAIVCGVQDTYVDISAPSVDLIYHDSTKYQPLYKKFGLTVGHAVNIRGWSQTKTNIIYGRPCDFEFDYLGGKLGERQSTRTAITCLMDECDNTMLDTQGTPSILGAQLPQYDNILYSYIWVYATAQDTELTPLALQDYVNKKTGHTFPFHIVKTWITGIDNARSSLYNEDYTLVITDFGGQIIAIDKFHTGHLLGGQRWSHGTHAFLEVEHGLPSKGENFTPAQITHLEYFKRYPRFYGVTGTLPSPQELAWLQTQYGVSYFYSPPYLPSKRTEEEVILVENEQQHSQAILDDLKAKTKAGRPVLLISQTVEDSLKYQHLLKPLETTVQIYNGTQEEAYQDLISIAGNPGVITSATNTAARGNDIPTTPQAEKNGGLYVALTYPAFNLRVEKQAFGRTNRQGNNGSYRYILHKDQLRPLFKKYNQSLPENSADVIAQWKELRERETALQVNIRERDSRFFHLTVIVQDAFFELFSTANHQIVSKDIWVEEFDYYNKLITEATHSNRPTSHEEALRHTYQFITRCWSRVETFAQEKQQPLPYSSLLHLLIVNDNTQLAFIFLSYGLKEGKQISLTNNLLALAKPEMLKILSRFFSFTPPAAAEQKETPRKEPAKISTSPRVSLFSPDGKPFPPDNNPSNNAGPPAPGT